MTIKVNRRLGRTAEGFEVYVDVYYGHDRLGNAEKIPMIESAVTHKQIPYPDALTISGDVVDPTKRGDAKFVSGGQTISDVRSIVSPAGSLTLDDVQRFADLWEAWHLNAMRAGCVHMDTAIPEGTVLPERYGRPDVTGWRIENLSCPETGYWYGSGWLAEPVPDEVVAEIAALLDKAHL